MEQLQEGYVASVAAAAGCNMEPIPRDNYGFDIRLVRPHAPGDEEVVLQAQLKNTTLSKPDPSKSHFSYKLKKREYLERLAAPRRYNKAILVVMATSPKQASWVTVDHEALLVRHCCYWACLEGESVDPTVSSPTVRIPTANIFDGSALNKLMDKIQRGEPLR
jgi:hypothetical protein